MPVQVGDRITLRIDTLAFGGDGIARLDGLVYFVPFAAPGDTVEAIVTDKNTRMARARIDSIVAPSPQRAEPPCSFFLKCGGCQYQHLTYEAELSAKETQIRDAFQRIAKLPDPPIHPILSSPEPYHYRNRITVHTQDHATGFHGVNARDIIDIDSCLLALPEVNDALTRLRASHPRDGHYSLRHPNIPPSAFYQVNHRLLDTLRDTVSATFPSSMDLAIDAYCGGGFFTTELIGKFNRVIGIEQDSRSLRDAHRIKAKNLALIEGAVENELEAILRENNLSQTALLLDPPREGLNASLARNLIELRPSHLTYVSCHPPTLARDAQKLLPHYNLLSVQPIDLFPRTSQIECVTTWVPR